MACGNGRYAHYRAGQGLSVVAIGLSRCPLVAASAQAYRSRLKVTYAQAYLVTLAHPCNAFSLAMCFKHRDRNPCPCLLAPLRSHGLFTGKTCTLEHFQCGLTSRDPAHLPCRHEWLQAFAAWEAVYSREAWIGGGVASLVAPKPFSAAVC